jgi:hypothetical protein
MKRTHQHAAVPESLKRGRGRASAAPFGSVMALQRGAGNRAVAGLLARDAKTAPKEAKAANTVVIPGLGTIEIESMQLPWGGSIAGHSQGASREAGITTAKELIFTSKMGKHSQALWAESLRGEARDVDVRVGELHLKLKGALVSSYSIGSGGDVPIESWTLSVESIEIVRTEQKTPPAPAPEPVRG